jgi:uncharacterized membrane protein (DUF2068 family)
MADGKPSSANETETPRGPVGFRVIGAIKLASGLGLFAAWLGMFRYFHSDAADQIDWLARHLKLDPENRVFHTALLWVSGLDAKTVKAIEAGTLFYALLHLIEGIGLVLERDWAGYLTVVATSALVPFECYEVVHKASALKAAVLVVNLGFVAYVVYKLRQERLRRGSGLVSEMTRRGAGGD